MALNFSKLDKFEGVDFRRWQKKMHFLLSSMSVVYVLTTPIFKDDGDDATMEQIRKKPSGTMMTMSAEKDFKHTLRHLKEELTLIELGSHLRIKESLRVQDNDKLKGNNVAGPLVVNMMEHNNSSRLNIINDNIASAFISTSKLNDSILWHARLGHVHFKDGLIPDFDMDTEKCIECIFFGYAEHSKAFKFYVIEPNDLVSINFIIKSRDVIFDENRFSSVPRPSLRIPNGTEYIGGSVALGEVTKKVIQQPEP
nr:zinc finger, CCHC-type [Tanacetum cinerariifolium]